MSDVNTPWLHFYFDIYERMFFGFVEEMWIEYDDPSSQARKAVQKASCKINDIMRSGGEGIEDFDAIIESAQEHGVIQK